MAETIIPWGDGSGDNLYLTYPSASGSQTVSVASDANGTGVARTKVVTVSASGVTPVTLTVTQAAGTPQEVTVSVHPTSYDTADYSYYSISNPGNAYADSDNTTYCSVRAKNGNYAETWVFFQFDLSAIPAGATILEVACKVKASYTANSTIMPTHEVQMFSGTNPKGSPTTLGTSASEKTLDVGNWTRAELEDARVRIYLQRSTTQPSTAYYGRFYGATLTIKYTI